MFVDMFNALDTGNEPMETFYDGYVVNAIIDACYRSAKSKQWEPVELQDWRGGDQSMDIGVTTTKVDEQHVLIKKEQMPDGRIKLIMKQKESGKIVEKIMDKE